MLNKNINPEPIKVSTKINTQKSYIIAPIQIKSDIQNKTELLENTYIEKLNEEEKTLLRSEPEEYQNICSFNYKIILDTKDTSRKKEFAINKAIRLLNLGNSGLFYQIDYPPGINIINSFYPYFKELPITEINAADITKLKELASKAFDFAEKDKLDLLFNFYKFATTGLSFIPVSTRFLNLMIILEVLFNPNGDNTELTFKISLRCSKLFENHGFKFNDSVGNESVKDRFELIKKYYKIRSKIVHTGKSHDLNNEKLIELIDITRKTLQLYVKHPSDFKEEKLNEVLFN